MADFLEAGDPEGSEATQPQSTLNPLRAVWRHKLLVALGVVAGCTLGGLYYARAKPIYQSSAQLLVVKKTPDALPLPNTDPRASYSEDYLSTHMALIRSPLIVSQAVELANLKALSSFAGRGDPTSAIIGSLKLAREMNGGIPTNILNISYKGPVIEDSQIVVKAVIDSYEQFLSAQYKSGSDETAKLITDAHEILEKKLIRQKKEYHQFSLDNPTLWKGKDGVSVVQERLSSLEAKRSHLILQETELQGRVDAFEKAVKEGRLSRPELLAIISQTTGKSTSADSLTAASALEERLWALELQEKTLLEDFGANYPQVKSVRGQLSLLRAQMRRLGKTGVSDLEAPFDPVKTHLQTLKLELENTRMTAAALDKLLVKERQAVKSMRSAENQDELYRLEISGCQQLFDVISKRLTEVSLLKNFAGGYKAKTITPPGPGYKVYPSLVTILGAALILGLLFGCGLAYLAEFSDQCFRTPEEISQLLGLPVVGHIPYFKAIPAAGHAAGGRPRLDPCLCAVFQPRSVEAEAFRGVRTALYFSTRGGARQVIQVTSPDKGDGKSTLAANLAVSIAQSEKRVVLIDADFRRPYLHKLFDVSGAAGLASVIIGEAELAEVIQPTAVSGLYVLPCGPIPPNPSELLTLARFQETLAEIREQFDFVVIDTPPLLVVTDPCVVVPHVDGVILTVRLSKNAKPHAARAREILATLGATIFGVVVNGVNEDAHSYDYSHYGCGYPSGSDDDENNAFDSVASKDGVRNGTTALAPPRRSRKKAGWLKWLFKRRAR